MTTCFIFSDKRSKIWRTVLQCNSEWHYCRKKTVEDNSQSENV